MLLEKAKQSKKDYITILDAIIIVLKEKARLTTREIYEQIVKKKLYEFGAKNPESVVRIEIMRHCLDIDSYKKKSPQKYFTSYSSGKGEIRTFSLREDKCFNDMDKQKRRINLMNEPVGSSNQDIIYSFDWESDESVSDLVPKKISFRGMDLFVNTWKEMLIHVCNLLMRFIPYVKIQNFQTNSHIKKIFSQKNNRQDGYLPLDRGYCVYTGFSDEIILKIIKELFLYYKIDIKQLKLTVQRYDKKVKYCIDNSTTIDTNKPLEYKQVTTEKIYKKLSEVFLNKYPNGFLFSATTLKLLEGFIGMEVDDTIKKIIKDKMFHRNDGLYFCTNSIETVEISIEILTKILDWFDRYLFFDISRLYELFSQKISTTMIRNERDFADFLCHLTSLCNRRVKYKKHTIIPFTDLSKNQIIDKMINMINDSINAFGGTISEQDLINEFEFLSSGLILTLLNEKLKNVVKTEINGIVYYQFFDLLGLPSNFSLLLKETLRELDNMGIAANENAINIALSIKMGLNFKKEYNIVDEKTFRAIISNYYNVEEKGDNRNLRNWDKGVFSINLEGK